MTAPGRYETIRQGLTYCYRSQQFIEGDELWFVGTSGKEGLHDVPAKNQTYQSDHRWFDDEHGGPCEHEGNHRSEGLVEVDILGARLGYHGT